MKRYAVLVREIWIQVYETDADSAEDAIARVQRDEVDPADGLIEYGHRLPPNTWTVEAVDTSAHQTNVVTN